MANIKKKFFSKFSFLFLESNQIGKKRLNLDKTHTLLTTAAIHRILWRLLCAVPRMSQTTQLGGPMPRGVHAISSHGTWALLAQKNGVGQKCTHTTIIGTPPPHHFGPVRPINLPSHLLLVPNVCGEPSTPHHHGGKEGRRRCRSLGDSLHTGKKAGGKKGIL